MPHRTFPTLLLVLGLLAVLALLLIGTNLERAQRRGPRWKRRLVAAGLAALGVLGVAPVGPGGSVAAAESPDKDALARSEKYTKLTALRAEAEEVATGKRGQYPFDEAGKKKLLDALAEAPSQVRALVSEGLLNEAEGALYEKDLAELTRGVQSMRPREMELATCYEPMMYTPGRDGVARLEARVPMLEKLAESKALHPAVVKKVLEKVAADLALLRNAESSNDLKADDRKKADELVRKVDGLVKKVERRLSGDPKGAFGTPEWRTITAGLDKAGKLAAGGSTTAEREETTKALDAARTAAGALAAAGRIAQEEATLIGLEADRLHTAIYRDPPTDAQVTCYDMAYMPPARDSLERLNRRLPLLEKLARGGKVRAEVIRRILPTVEADIRTLGDKQMVGELPPEEQKKAAETRSAAEAALASVKGALEPTR